MWFENVHLAVPSAPSWPIVRPPLLTLWMSPALLQVLLEVARPHPWGHAFTPSTRFGTFLQAWQDCLHDPRYADIVRDPHGPFPGHLHGSRSQRNSLASHISDTPLALQEEPYPRLSREAPAQAAPEYGHSSGASEQERRRRSGLGLEDGAGRKGEVGH